jgi:hypothetical protein
MGAGSPAPVAMMMRTTCGIAGHGVEDHDSLVRVADAPSTSLAGRWSACGHSQNNLRQPEQRPERVQLPGRGR